MKLLSVRFRHTWKSELCLLLMQKAAASAADDDDNGSLRTPEAAARPVGQVQLELARHGLQGEVVEGGMIFPM